MKKQMTLDKLEIGKSATVKVVGGDGALRQHFLDMGIIPGEQVTLVKYAPMGDPMELSVNGYELTLRLADAREIEIENITDKLVDETETNLDKKKRRRESSHPGIGEDTIDETYTTRVRSIKNDKTAGDKPLTFALVGNQNCGKTTLFNELTGSNQHVGNFPGVTVDRKSGVIKGYPNTEVVDLPGIYSLSPYTSEEIVSRQFILEEKPTAIINIVDATNIERNLYLTMQLIEL